MQFFHNFRKFKASLFHAFKGGGQGNNSLFYREVSAPIDSHFLWFEAASSVLMVLSFDAAMVLLDSCAVVMVIPF